MCITRKLKKYIFIIKLIVYRFIFSTLITFTVLSYPFLVLTSMYVEVSPSTLLKQINKSLESVENQFSVHGEIN